MRKWLRNLLRRASGRLANEPAVEAAIVALAAWLTDKADGLDVDAMVDQLAAHPWGAVAIVALGIIVRQTVLGPRSADRVMDAEKVIGEAERG